MNALPMIEPTSWCRRATCLAMGLGLLGAATAASAQTRLSLADLAAQIEALRGQVTTLTQANSNLQGQLDSLNANLGVVQLGVAGAQVKAQDAQNRAATVATDLAALQANSVLALDGILAYDVASETARFTGVDVQVTNGQGANTINGRGNLIVGYNQARTGAAICSKGGDAGNSQSACESFGGVWAANHKSGSHNLVVGEGHAYSSFGGVLFGQNNAVTSWTGTVLGGVNNVVRADRGSVAAGAANVVIGNGAVVSGGSLNRALGAWSRIGGGYQNSTDAAYSVVSGGYGHLVPSSATYSWRGGGLSSPN